MVAQELIPTCISCPKIFLDAKVYNLVKEIISILELLFVVSSAAHIGLFEEGGNIEKEKLPRTNSV